jgi:hypothetical protein
VDSFQHLDQNFTSQLNSCSTRKMPLKTLKAVEGERNARGFIDLDTTRELPIKRSMSAYVLFGNERREQIVRQHGPGLKVTEVVKLIAAEWRKMNKQEKSRFKDLAKEDKLRFQTELNQLKTLDGRQPDDSHQLQLERPKKPLTPYMLFVRETRKIVVDTMPHVRSLNIMKEVGRNWKTITNKEL